MAENTKIQWTSATWNPVRGCTRVSPGCGGPGKVGGCYAEAQAALRFSKPGQPYHGVAEMVALIESILTLPLDWKKAHRIFVNSMSDMYRENLPDGAIDRVFAVMALCPQGVP
jgi:protein gp37